METKTGANFWWVKSSPKLTIPETTNNPALTVPRLDLDISSSLADFLDREQNLVSSSINDNHTDVDVGSIIEEINRVAAQSPLGPFERSVGERSFDDIMKEAERVYMESSKSFEQLSQHSKTSQNISELRSSLSDSTPTPKSVSPLPLDVDRKRSGSASEGDLYSEDFSDEDGKSEDTPEIDDGFRILPKLQLQSEQTEIEVETGRKKGFDEDFVVEESGKIKSLEEEKLSEPKEIVEETKEIQVELDLKDERIRGLQEDNLALRNDIREIKQQLQQTTTLFDQSRAALKSKPTTPSELNSELHRVLENLKDSQEINTSLQLQLDGLNKTHQHLKSSYEDLLSSNKSLERRVVELDTTLTKYKSELVNIQHFKDKLQENEISLSKLLEIEKLQSKSIKLQNEKDSKCIQDLNRQIKEMERIIARKHPDSVSALIVAAKNDVTDSNLTARRLLESRIKSLEEEANKRDSQSSKVFLDIQDKFNQMKLKYESHIDDLELHVSDLKTQLKQKIYDTFDVYTQTYEEQKIPQKDSTFCNTSTQTDVIKLVAVKKRQEKEDTHLLSTIRGFQADLTNKEKSLNKLNKELEELKKTNRRLQKEREGSLRNLSEKRSYRLSKSSTTDFSQDGLEEELKLVKKEREKLKQQLCRLQEDHQTLLEKRLHDLNALQEAHEVELQNCASSLAPLKEQLQLQQVNLSNLQCQLSASKEELAIVTVERDHLNNQLMTSSNKHFPAKEVEVLHKKVTFLEKRYEEREHRLRAIVHGLAQKNVTNRSCQQCGERQQQLIGYKLELDQLLATLRSLQ